MVLFVDMEDEAAEPPEDIPEQWRHLHHRQLGRVSLIEAESTDKERFNPNDTAVTGAMGCYPVVMSIAANIDLNTLDALSRSCRQIRANLLQFRTQLLASTMHCVNEQVKPDPEHTLRYRARATDWYFVDTGRNTSDVGKVGDCARDLVGECRRCARVVCRNCTIKAPAPILLAHRHRRICSTCQRVPLTSLMSPRPCAEPHSSITSPSSFSTVTSNTPSEVKSNLLRQSLCTCAKEGVWLCQPCGRSLRNTDMEYQSIWKWRTRYLPSLGGLGVGIGEGNRGVPCGRDGECIAAREVEQETDCDAEDAREANGSPAPSPGPGLGFGGSISIGIGKDSSHSHSHSPHEHTGPGYIRHEVEGIGGVMKKLVVRMVKVGACVPEFGEEKVGGVFLVREIDGRARSWCGWCWRVIPGSKDLDEL